MINNSHTRGPGKAGLSAPVPQGCAERGVLGACCGAETPTPGSVPRGHTEPSILLPGAESRGHRGSPEPSPVPLVRTREETRAGSGHVRASPRPFPAALAPRVFAAPVGPGGAPGGGRERAR